MTKEDQRIKKRSIILDGKHTSVSLEAKFWGILREMAAEKEQNVSTLITTIDGTRTTPNQSSALRLAVLEHVTHGR